MRVYNENAWLPLSLDDIFIITHGFICRDHVRAEGITVIPRQQQNHYPGRRHQGITVLLINHRGNPQVRAVGIAHPTEPILDEVR